MQIQKIHYISGFTLAIFIAIHLLNHLSSVFGAATHIAVMKNLRLFYRNVFVESVLLFAVFTQIVSGIYLFAGKRKTAKTSFGKLQIYTGLYLAIFLVVHLGAVFTGRLYLHLDTNFYFGVAGLNTFPFSLFFIPYYALAIISIFGHLAAVHNGKMKYNIFGLIPARQSILVIVTGLVLMLVIFYGLTNRFQGVAIPEKYNVLIGK